MGLLVAERGHLFLWGQRSESWTRKKKYQETLSQNGKIWQGYGHCEEMTQNTEAYLTFVKEFLDSDLWNEKDKS